MSVQPSETTQSHCIRTKDAPSALVPEEFTEVLGAQCQKWGRRPNIYISSYKSQYRTCAEDSEQALIGKVFVGDPKVLQPGESSYTLLFPPQGP